jgi:hypothetical protein
METTRFINALMGFKIYLPSGTDRKFQLEYSTLLEDIKETNYLNKADSDYLRLVLSDRQKPSRAKLFVHNSLVNGLDNALILLSSLQVELFEQGLPVVQETDVKATRGAYFLQSEFELPKEKTKTWYFAADVFKDQVDVVSLSSLICLGGNLAEQIEKEILISNIQLNLKLEVPMDSSCQTIKEQLSDISRM